MMAITGGNKGRCYWCLKVLKWIPVALTATLLVWSYYAYVIQYCLLTVDDLVMTILFLVPFHAIFFMLSWSYWQIISTDIAGVPVAYEIPNNIFAAYLNNSDNYEYQNTILENLAKNLPIVTTTLMGGVRICQRCKVLKPDRAHHCSVCGVCVLKMDHHCPWINKCICFTNYKYFILFLGYGFLYCVYVSLTTLVYFIAFCKGSPAGRERFQILFLFFVSIMFGISLLLLFSYHCYLVTLNRTTLEAMRSPNFRDTGINKYGFHIGKYKNVQEVFGTDLMKWFIPVKTTLGDGLTYPLRSGLQQTIYSSI